MEESVKSLEAEVEKIKISIAPLLSFLQDLSDTKKGFHISAESKVSNLKVLTLSVKSEVISEVNNLIMVTEEHIKTELEESKTKQLEINERIHNLRRQDEHLEQMIKETQDLIVKHGNFIEVLKRETDFNKRVIDEKVGYIEFLKLEKELKNYAPLEDMLNIAAKIETLAEKTHVEFLKQSIKKVNTKLFELVPRKELDEKLSEVQEQIFKELEKKFISNYKFEKEISELLKNIHKDEDDFKALAKKVDSMYDGFRRKIGELFETLNSKPWDAEVKNLNFLLDKTVSKDELQKFKDESLEKHSKSFKSISELEKNISQFSELVERYDEIMLDKASKDDVRLLTKQLEKYVLKSTFNELNDRSIARFGTIDSQIGMLFHSEDITKSNLSTVSQKVDIIRKENFEVSNISSTLARIQETLEHKADKSDIYIIYDVMGKKEELQRLSEIEAVCRKQVLLSVGMIQSLCRTMITPGDSAGNAQKQRLDIFRSLEGLQRWIKEGTGEPSSFLAIGRSNVSLKFDTIEDGHFHPSTTKYSTRRGGRYGSVGTSPKCFKDELPALNL
jgi:hypothetical protein